MSDTQSKSAFPKAEFLEFNTEPGISYYIIVPCLLLMYKYFNISVFQHRNISVKQKNGVPNIIHSSSASLNPVCGGTHADKLLLRTEKHANI
jgi:hypothetical protein